MAKIHTGFLFLFFFQYITSDLLQNNTGTLPKVSNNLLPNNTQPLPQLTSKLLPNNNTRSLPNVTSDILSNNTQLLPKIAGDVQLNNAKPLLEICNQTLFTQHLQDSGIPNKTYINSIKKKCSRLYPKCKIGQAHPYLTISSYHKGLVVGLWRPIALEKGCWGYLLTVTSRNETKLLFSKYYSNYTKGETNKNHKLNFTDDFVAEKVQVRLTELPSGQHYEYVYSLPKNSCELEARIKAEGYFFQVIKNSKCNSYPSQPMMQSIAESYCHYYNNPSKQEIHDNMNKTLEHNHCTITFKVPSSAIHNAPGCFIIHHIRKFSPLEIVLIIISCGTSIALLLIFGCALWKRCSSEPKQKDEFLLLETPEE